MRLLLLKKGYWIEYKKTPEKTTPQPIDDVTQKKQIKHLLIFILYHDYVLING